MSSATLTINVIYREAKIDDWKGILKLYNSLSDEDLCLRFFAYHRLTEEEAKKIADTRDHYTLVAEYNGVIIGEASLYPDGELAVVVAPSFRKYGIGTELVKRLIEYAKSHNMKAVKFYTLPENIPMIKIGKKLGFKITVREDEVFAYLDLSNKS